MPELTVGLIGLVIAAILLGIVLGWAVRSRKSRHEKLAVSASWQEQLDAQRNEHERLVAQNKNLMEQVSQFQASGRDARNRAKELSAVVQEAFARRDELQREIKDIRSNLEVAVRQRDKLQTDLAEHGGREEMMRQKDDKIFQLSRELENWQERLPPLLERYRVRDDEAKVLEAELAQARARIHALEGEDDEVQTRIEPVHDPDDLTDGRGASNDPIDEASGKHEIARDDLKKIKGVGPAIEKTLNEIGIYRYEQIAAMSEYDIDRVAQRLKGFHSRIYREDWMGQARELLEHDRSA